MTTPAMAAVTTAMAAAVNNQNKNTGSVFIDSPVEAILMVVAALFFVLLLSIVGVKILELSYDHPVIAVLCIVAIILLCGGLLCIV